MFPYKITFVDCDHSPSVASEIENHLERLHRHFDDITSCDVMVRMPHRHGSRRIFNVHILINIPRTQIVVSHEKLDGPNVIISTAIHDAFAKAIRQLDSFKKKHESCSA